MKIKEKKQVDALENLKTKEQTKVIKYDDDDKDTSLEQKKKVIINYLTRNLMRYKS